VRRENPAASIAEQKALARPEILAITRAAKREDLGKFTPEQAADQILKDWDSYQ
jgi:hypothetical protein